MITYCDVIDRCEDCPRYGDDCDGDKRVEHTDYISRADAIKAVASITMSIHLSDVICDKLLALPSAEAVDVAHDIPEYCSWSQTYTNMVQSAMSKASADAVKRVDCSNFLLWLLEEIMDEDNWEFNAVADGEIIARKLKKLGLLEVKDGYYHRIFDENVWVVRCKDCEYADFNSPYPVCNFLEMNICENGYCSWARMKGGAE